MKILLSAFVMFAFIGLLNSCDTPGSKRLIGLDPDNLPAKGIEDGEQTVYSKSGKVESIVEVKDGKANGRVRKYYEDGKLRMDAIYKDGRKNGKCIYYYANGSAFSESIYADGYKDGEEKKYYEDGKLLAIQTYKKNKVQPGLKEYNKNGKAIKHDVSILVKEIDRSALEGVYRLVISLSDDSYRASYYVITPDKPESRQILKASGRSGVMEFYVSQGSFLMKKLLFEAECKTSKGNILILQKKYNLAIDL